MKTYKIGDMITINRCIDGISCLTCVGEQFRTGEVIDRYQDGSHMHLEATFTKHCGRPFCTVDEDCVIDSYISAKAKRVERMTL